MAKAILRKDELPREDAWRWRRYRIMKEMGWNIREYNRAPVSLVAEIWAFMQTEAQIQAAETGGQ